MIMTNEADADNDSDAESDSNKTTQVRNCVHILFEWISLNILTHSFYLFTFFIRKKSTIKNEADSTADEYKQ